VLVARILSVLTVAALLMPLTYRAGEDSFPLSNYPMFARARSSPELKLTYFVVDLSGGGRRAVAPADVANVEVLQAASLIADADRRGADARRRLCATVARRLASRRDHGGATLRMVRGKHDAVALLTAGTRGVERTLARCAIPAGQEPR
jgi:hypothetical protein